MMAGNRYNSSYRIVHRDNTDFILWLFLSAAIHAILATAAVLSPKPAHKIFYSPVYEVDLVPMPETVKVEHPAPRQEAVKPVEIPKPEKTIQKIQKSGKTTVLPKALRETPKPDEAVSRLREKIAAEEAVDRIRKKIREKEASTSGVKVTQKAPAKVYRYEELDAELKAYFDKISREISEAWSLPDTLRNKGYKAVLTIHVARSGVIESLYIEEASGNRYYDDSALRAINKVNPLPPLPEGWKGDYIDLGFRF